MSACLKKAGVVLDTSKDTGNMYIVQSSNYLETLPVISLIGRKSIGYCIYSCNKLMTIEKVILKSDGSQTFTDYSFGQNSALEEIRFEGVIGKAGFNMKWSTKLSHDSIVSIVNALSTTTSGLSITLSKTAVNSAFATTTGGTDGSTSAEWTALVATRSNWTISLA
jgi:hypothetical protein